MNDDAKKSLSALARRAGVQENPFRFHSGMGVDLSNRMVVLGGDVLFGARIASPGFGRDYRVSLIRFRRGLWALTAGNGMQKMRQPAAINAARDRPQAPA